MEIVTIVARPCDFVMCLETVEVGRFVLLDDQERAFHNEDCLDRQQAEDFLVESIV